MSKPLLIIGLIALLFASSASVAAHPPAEDDAPDPLLRNLYLVYDAASQKPRNQSYSASTQMADDGYRLSLANDTSSASRSYAFREPPLASVCTSSTGCGPYYLKAAGKHAGDDIQIEAVDAIDGVIHFSWAFSTPVPPLIYGNRVVGVMQFGLSVGDRQYKAPAIPLGYGRQDVVAPLSFTYSAPHCEERPKNGSAGHHACTATPEDVQAAQTWTRDVQLWFTVQTHRDYVGRPLGSSGNLKIDTAGGSFLTVREVPPPPPVEVVEPSLEEGQAIPLEASYVDADGDGEMDADELHFVPAASPALLLAGLAGVGFLLRRRR